MGCCIHVVDISLSMLLISVCHVVLVFFFREKTSSFGVPVQITPYYIYIYIHMFVLFLAWSQQSKKNAKSISSLVSSWRRYHPDFPWWMIRGWNRNETWPLDHSWDPAMGPIGEVIDPERGPLLWFSETPKTKKATIESTENHKWCCWKTGSCLKTLGFSGLADGFVWKKIRGNSWNPTPKFDSWEMLRTSICLYCSYNIWSFETVSLPFLDRPTCFNSPNGVQLQSFARWQVLMWKMWGPDAGVSGTSIAGGFISWKIHQNWGSPILENPRNGDGSKPITTIFVKT